MGDLSHREKKHLHKSLRHPKKSKKNHMGGARSHRHIDMARHHHEDMHPRKSLDLGNLGGDKPKKHEMSMAKKGSAKREKRLANVPL